MIEPGRNSVFRVSAVAPLETCDEHPAFRAARK
jgi:hypothetical protein